MWRRPSAGIWHRVLWNTVALNKRAAFTKVIDEHLIYLDNRSRSFFWNVGTQPDYIASHPKSHEKLKSHVWPFKACWLLDGPRGLTFKSSTSYRHSILCFFRTNSKFALYNTKWLVLQLRWKVFTARYEMGL